MTKKFFTTPIIKEDVKGLRAGEWVTITGTIYGARDMTHKRLVELIEEDMPLPVSLKGAIIYYVGPTPAPPNRVAGSLGPTTSYRMDAYTPKILDAGALALIGKGRRSDEVKEHLVRRGAVYLATFGGAGAYLSECVKEIEVIAFPELGPEAMFRLEVEGFPAIVINDIVGNDYYDMVMPL